MALYKLCGCGREPLKPHTKHTKDSHISYYYPPGRRGKKICQKVGPNKDEAQIVLSTRLQDIRQGRNPELRRIAPKPFKEMVAEYLEHHVRREGLDHRSAKMNTDLLVNHFGAKTLQDITPREVEDFIAARLAEGVAESTTNRQRACLSGIFKCAIKRGCYGGENPVKAVKAYAEPPGRARFLTADEADALIGKASKHLRPIIVTALHTGGRLSEVLSLRWSDIDLENGVLYFDRDTTKGGKQREIPIDAELAAVLQQHGRVRSITGYVFTWGGKAIQRVTTAFEKARKDADLEKGVGMHTLRHTFGSWYMMNGGDLYRLKGYMGHSDIKLTERYAHLSPQYRRAGVAFFGAPRGDGSQSVVILGQSSESRSSASA